MSQEAWILAIGFLVVSALFLHSSYMLRRSYEREQVLRDWIDKLLDMEDEFQ